MKTLKDIITISIGIILLLAVVGGAIWANMSAPCEAFAHSRAADIPGRCVMREAN